ncbi:6043_t:CDS:1, partial [Dentiscutata erythropus]
LIDICNVQVSEDDDYLTEEETEEVVSSGEVSLSNVVEKKEDDFVSKISNIEFEDSQFIFSNQIILKGK